MAAADRASTGQEIPTDDRPTQIGPYRILDQLGEGGMAVVYLAEQDLPIRRRVALKILKPGMDSRQIVSRFESERQALAVLDHPNVAKIYDGGMTDAGRPYFVMELVRGLPITRYCDDHRLDTAARLELFITVCSAVQHAHHKGLIHRDLKPSNILVGVVDGRPQPKIIDFGIAKATSTPLTEETLYTRVGQVVGTPQYMSPEQASPTAVDIDTRSDIYSLGVVLYELLVGAPPIDVMALGDQAMRIVLQEKEPPRPSTRFSQLGDTRDEIAKVRRTLPRDLRRELRGDLDWIVMRAIEKDRTRRYETPSALAMECRRFLRSEPVMARPPSASYLLRRFVRRNRFTVGAASIAVLAILAGASAATLGYLRATAAERVAQQEARTANQVSEFLVELFRVSDPSVARGNTVTAREILDRGADRITRELSSEPEVQAALMKTMGDAYASLGLYEDAQPLLDAALQKSLESAGHSSGSTAESLYSLGQLALYRGDFVRSETLQQEALEILRQTPDADPLSVARTLRGIGEALYFQGEYEQAEDVFLEARELYISSAGEDSLAHADLMKVLGSLYHNTDRFEEAEALFRRSLGIFRESYGNLHRSVAATLNDLGLVLRETGSLEEAERRLRESLEIRKRLYHGDHPELAETEAHVAGVLNSLGRDKEAEALYRDAIAMLERTVGREHMLTARAYDSLGVLLLANRRYEEAETVITDAIEVQRALLGDRHVNTARSLNNMAAILFLQGKYALAEPYFRESLDIRIEQLGAENGDVANSKNNLADLLNRVGRYAEAEPLAAEAAETYSRIFSPQHWRAAVARNIQGASLAGQGRFAEAEPLLVESADSIGEVLPGRIYHRMALQRTIDFYRQWDKPEQAVAWQRRLDCAQDSANCD